ncbi:MAG: DNA gyrase subunit A [Sarcina sp.]
MAKKKEDLFQITEIPKVDMSKQMKDDILEYGQYVMEHRAIPRITDGFLTGEGRIVYGMYNMGNTCDGPYKKSARAVGHILAELHPHSDSATYGTMVKLSQPWNTNVQLVDISGSNGNLTGDGAAAYRYCVTGDTMISLPGIKNAKHTYKSIEDLYNECKTYDEELSGICDNLEVVDQTDDRVKVSKIFNCGKHPIIKIELEDGYTLKGTYNHPIKVRVGLEIIWMTLEELTEGREVLSRDRDTLMGFYSLRKIIKIERLEEEEVVYSPKVESDCHSYIANGIVSHNTEARLTKIAKLLTDDLRYETVDMIPNFDGTTNEPSELPSRIPLLLINGAYGIAVGFSSSFAQHNAYDSTMLCKMFNLNRDMDINEMIEIIKAPDFPTGGTINGLDTVRKGYLTGRGSCRVRGDVEIKTNSKGYEEIDIISLPPKTNYDAFKDRVSALAQTGDIKLRERIKDFTDGSGIRIKLILKKEEDTNRVVNLLYKAGLEGSYTLNHRALVNGVPRNVTLKDVVKTFVEFRESVVYRRSKFKMNKAENDLHIQKGLRIVYDNLDDVIKTIRKSDNDKEAVQVLIKKFKLSEKQANYILEMKLRRLTSLESDLVDKKIKELNKEIEVLTKITNSKSNKHITKIIDEEFDEALAILKKEYGTERKTAIIEVKKEISTIDTVKDEPRTFVYTTNGRLKNMNIVFNPQGRNGTGNTLLSQDDDNIEIVLPTTTTSKVHIFTNIGKMYTVEPYKIDVTSKSARGTLAKTILGLANDERIIYMKSVPRDYDSKNKFIVFTTNKGKLKKSKYEEYENVTSAGKLAIKLDKDDSVASVQLYEKNGNTDILISTYEGYSLRTGLDKITPLGRVANGVNGIKLKNDKDRVVSAIVVNKNEDFVFFINENGMTKKVEVSEFQSQGRGGFGVISGSKLVSVVPDTPGFENLLIVSKQNMNIVIEKSSIRKVGRTGLGVKGIKLGKGDAVLKMFEN